MPWLVQQYSYVEYQFNFLVYNIQRTSIKIFAPNSPTQHEILFSKIVVH
jgi:hypothetical protein